MTFVIEDNNDAFPPFQKMFCGNIKRSEFNYFFLEKNQYFDQFDQSSSSEKRHTSWWLTERISVDLTAHDPGLMPHHS